VAKEVGDKMTERIERGETIESMNESPLREVLTDRVPNLTPT